MSYPASTVHRVDDLLRGLDATQRDAVTSSAAPLAILAGAGSGKTRVLTRRIAWQSREGIIDPRHVLARHVHPQGRRRAPHPARPASASSMRSPPARSTPSRSRSCAAAPKTSSARCPTLLERKVRLLVPLVSVRGREAGLRRRRARVRDRVGEGAARHAPTATRRRSRSPARTPPRPAAEVADVFREYERAEARRGLVDFDDLITGCADVLERDADFAAAQRWRFRHLFVDEFQDASPAQFRLLRVVARRPLRPLRRRRRRPGDLRVRRRRPHLPRAVHRAVPARAVPRRRRRPARQQLPLHARRSWRPPARCSAPRARRAAERAARPDGPAPVVTAYDTDDDEARGVARAVRAAHASEVPWSRIAVLYRVNAQSALFEEAFSRAGVPFRVRGGGRFLERPEVKVALDALQESARDGPSRTFAEHLTDLTVAPTTSCRGAARAHRRASCASATSTSTPRAARSLARWQSGRSTASSRSSRPRSAATTPSPAR